MDEERFVYLDKLERRVHEYIKKHKLHEENEGKVFVFMVEGEVIVAKKDVYTFFEFYVAEGLYHV